MTRMNVRNLLVGATLPEALKMLVEAVWAGDDDRAGWIVEFILDYRNDW